MPDEEDDNHILPRTDWNDERARRTLHRYRQLVTLIARHWLRDPEEVEDAVQDVLLQLWRIAGEQRDLESEVAFVATFAKRRLIDRLRAHARNPRTTNTETTHECEARDTDTLEFREDASRIARALRTLRDVEQGVLHLTLVRGHTHEQVAAITGLPLGTVKTHARRGLDKLRDALDVHPPDSPK